MRNNLVKNWISNRVVVPTVQSMDKHMKRIVALASLFGYLFNRQHLNVDVEVRLSKTMDLAINPKSLSLPMLYHNMVWNSVEANNPREVMVIKKKFAEDKPKAVSGEEAKNFATVLVSLMPACLLYDSVEAIKKDLVHLFESIPFILGGKSLA